MQNDMRDRLVELLSIIPCNAESCSAVCDGRCQEFDDLDRCQIGQLVDHLIANGVQEVKHGNWIYNLTYYESDECNCSLCGQLMTTAKGVRMNYCPNCGAKMDRKGD